LLAIHPSLLPGAVYAAVRCIIALQSLLCKLKQRFVSQMKNEGDVVALTCYKGRTCLMSRVITKMALLTRSTSSTLPIRHSSWCDAKINKPGPPTRSFSTETILPSIFQTQAMPRAVPTRRESLGSEPPPRKSSISTTLPVKIKTKCPQHTCEINTIFPISSTASKRFHSSGLPGGRSSMNLDTNTTNAQTGESGSRKRRFSSGVSFYSDVIAKQRVHQRQTRSDYESSGKNADFMQKNEFIRKERWMISVKITNISMVVHLCLFLVICSLISNVYQIGMGYQNCLAK